MTDMPRVWVVYTDRRKDLSDAEKFGQLTDMFYHNQLPYVKNSDGKMVLDTNRVVKMARKMLRRYKEGDYILPIGDPILCQIVAAVVMMDYAKHERMQILRWDRKALEYDPETYDFSLDDEEQAYFDSLEENGPAQPEPIIHNREGL